jgi:hypothetical protein
MPFREFLQNNLSWADLENLNVHLGQSTKATTIMIDTPSKLGKLQIEKISELLQKWNPEYTPEYLISEFHAGQPEEEEQSLKK